MIEKGLRVLEADKTFFGKLTNTLTKLLIPTKIGINGMLIHVKRNTMLKAFEMTQDEEKMQDGTKKGELLKKYEDMYALYLESIDKYIMDSIYKKVKNNTANNFEKNALAKYYNVIHLKETQYIEYKYRKQKYLLELDEETIETQNKEKQLIRYQKFYAKKMEELYKAILKNYSIQLADNVSGEEEKTKIYEAIFSTLEEYIVEILPIKIELEEEHNYQQIMEDYDKFNTYLAGKLDENDRIKKKIILLGISRKLFTHSLPLVAAEQCYIRLLKDTRRRIIEEKAQGKKEYAYAMLIELIEDYNIRLLSTKIYWDKPTKREEYKIFWNAYQDIEKKKENKEEYQKQKEILFIQSDLKAVAQKQEKYQEIIQFYKDKLTQLGVMRKLKNKCQTIGNFTKKKKITV